MHCVDLMNCIASNLADIAQILQEAKNRWLRPAEICEILNNYETFQLKPEPPTKPAGL